MKEQELARWIEKYQFGECSPEEKAKVEAWYNSFSESPRQFYEGHDERIKQSERTSLAAIRKKLDLPEREVRPVRLLLRPANLAIAASILLVAALTLWFRLDNFQNAEHFSEVHVPNGKVYRINLPDGSKVWLNANSTLRYSSNYNRKERNLYLDGQGFFDVVHNPEKPFNVHTRQLNTHVMGTAFEVTAYKGMSNSSVTVVRGKVQVKSAKDLLAYLTPRRRLEYDLSTGSSKLSVVNPSSNLAWTAHKLDFANMTLQDIAVHLENRYGYAFRFEQEALKSTRFTASFNEHIGLDDILLVLRSASHAGYTIDHQHKTVTFLNPDQMKK